MMGLTSSCTFWSIFSGISLARNSYTYKAQPESVTTLSAMVNIHCSALTFASPMPDTTRSTETRWLAWNLSIRYFSSPISSWPSARQEVENRDVRVMSPHWHEPNKLILRRFWGRIRCARPQWGSTHSVHPVQRWGSIPPVLCRHQCTLWAVPRPSCLSVAERTINTLIPGKEDYLPAGRRTRSLHWVSAVHNQRLRNHWSIGPGECQSDVQRHPLLKILNVPRVNPRQFALTHLLLTSPFDLWNWQSYCSRVQQLPDRLSQEVFGF